MTPSILSPLSDPIPVWILAVLKEEYGEGPPTPIRICHYLCDTTCSQPGVDQPPWREDPITLCRKKGILPGASHCCSLLVAELPGPPSAGKAVSYLDGLQKCKMDQE